jgi:hypothetical protein
MVHPTFIPLATFQEYPVEDMKRHAQRDRANHAGA